jgi:co-chaperonin GroES (HSP10)
LSYTLNPTGNRLLVRLRPLPEKTGLIIRVNSDEAARPADVLAIGPNVRDVKMGRGVVVSTLAGQLVGEDIILPESSVLGFLDD